MKRLINKIKGTSIVKNDGKNFLHFFLAFTIIFVALTFIILQVLTAGAYRSTDSNLKRLSENTNFLKVQALNQVGISLPQQMTGDYGPNNYVLLYDSDGKILSKINSVSTTNTSQGNNDLVLSSLRGSMKFSSSDVDEIRMVTVNNAYGSNWHFKYLTTKFTVGSENYYLQIFSSIDQIQTSLERGTFVIITTMIGFWLISILVSLYLADWTLKPIVASYEKQKTFVENASHELRTPLAILQNRLELLFQNPMGTIIDESENISESLNEVRNMRMLTSNLLNLARREDGIKIEAVETKPAFFTTIFNNYQLLAENTGKKFTGNLQLSETIHVDQALVKQLMTILFDNAIKYTDDEGQVSITVEKSNSFLVFSVADNGEGISDEDKKRIFDRFFRVDKARTRQKGGLGLGLSLAKQIVDAYSGKIWVEDNLPQGSKFIVRLRIENSSLSTAKIFHKK